MTTEVSNMPRAKRSDTIWHVLVDGEVKILTQARVVDRRSVAEHFHDHGPGNEAVTAQWSKLADRDAIAAHNERFPLVQRAHNAATVVA